MRSGVTGVDADGLATWLFDGQVPDRDHYVLGHGFSRDLARCRLLVPDDRMWPAEFDQRGSVGAQVRVDRQALFDIATRAARADDFWAAMQLHVGIVVWHAGLGGLSERAWWPLMESVHSDLEPHLLTTVIRTLRVDGPERAFGLLAPHSRLWMDDLSGSEHTRFLYFGGYGAKPGRLQPLIMDANVMAALHALTGEQWVDGSRVDYVRYLYRVAEWASQLDTAGDVIERGLSRKGMTLLNRRLRPSRE